MKKSIVIVLMLSMITGAVFAQSMGLPNPNLFNGDATNTGSGGGFTSPQAAATQGRIRSSADDLVRPDAFVGIRYENWFGFASLANSDRATLGYTTKFTSEEEDKKPVFLSLFYNGRLWGNSHQKTFIEGRDYWLGEEKDDVRIYTAGTSLTTASPLNQFAVLFGLADMGFRLTLTSTYKSFNDENFATETDYFDYIDIGRGILSPQLAWSMTKNLNSKGIRPFATVDVVFSRDFNKEQGYSFDVAGDTWGKDDAIINHSRNNTLIELGAGLGGYIIAEKNSWRTQADLEYRLQYYMFNNEYLHGNNVFSTFNGINVGGALTERSLMTNKIRPILVTQWNGDKLQLRGKLDFNFDLTNNSFTPLYVKDNNGTLGIDGYTRDVLVLAFNPDLRLSARWQAADKLFVNFGTRINQTTSITTTKGEEYEDDVLTPNSSYKAFATSYGSTSNQLTLGVTINATDKLFIEATSGVGTNNGLSVFDTASGPMNFSSLLIGLRF